MKNHCKIFMKLSVAFCLMASVMSCKDDFFDLPDRAGIDTRIWSNEGSIEYMLNKTYSLVMPDFPYQYGANNYNIHMASDENFFSATDSWARRALGLNGILVNNDVRFVATKYQFNNKGDNRYFDIARCNLAIAGIPEGTLPKNIQDRLLGQFYALRAMTYFELVKIYGGVPLVLEPQDPQNLTLSGRASAEECFQAIFNDLDSAIVKLEGVVWNDATERGKINKVIAASLKGRAALYWASPQFNPKNHPSHAYESDRWNFALQATKEAYDLATAAGHRLLENYSNIFQTEGTANPEAIFVKSYSRQVERRGHNTESRTRPASEGGSPNDAFYASTKLIDSYLMKDGRPAQGHPDYDPVLFWQNRDPRFEASIAYNGSRWDLSGKTNRRQWTYVGAMGESGDRGFYSKRFATPNLPRESVAYSNNIGGSGMDWIEIRFAELMLNYAECANETGDIALAKDLVRRIRIRAGIVEGEGGNDYGLGSVGSDAEKMRLLIDNERMIEFAFEGKRNDDLRRRRLMHTLQGTIQGMRFEVKTSDMKSFLESVDPNTGLMRRDTLDINNKATVLHYFKYPYATIIPSGNGAFSVPEHYYFYTFHNQFMNSSPLLEHTIGWDGGTFDPLK